MPINNAAPANASLQSGGLPAVPGRTPPAAGVPSALQNAARELAFEQMRESIDYRAPWCDLLTPNPKNNKTQLTPFQVLKLVNHYEAVGLQGRQRLKAGEVTCHASKNCLKNVFFWGWLIREGERKAYTRTMEYVHNLVEKGGGVEATRAWLDPFGSLHTDA